MEVRWKLFAEFSANPNPVVACRLLKRVSVVTKEFKKNHEIVEILWSLVRQTFLPPLSIATMNNALR